MILRNYKSYHSSPYRISVPDFAKSTNVLVVLANQINKARYLINREANLDRSVLVNFGHYTLWVLVDFVCVGTVML